MSGNAMRDDDRDDAAPAPLCILDILIRMEVGRTTVRDAQHMRGVLNRANEVISALQARLIQLSDQVRALQPPRLQ